jgi:hypothetical protein
MAMTSGEAVLDGFIARYTPEIAASVHACLRRLQLLIPGAQILVYDNYNALAVGFGASEKAGDVVVSVAAYPRWVTLFFLKGFGLPDPDGLLRGSGSTVRNIRLDGPETLEKPEIVALIKTALAAAVPPIDATGISQIIIKSVSAKQRARRP